MELKKYRLGEVCTIIPGYAFKSSDFGCGKNWVIKIKDIAPPAINIATADKVAVTPSNKYKLSKGDYVMAMTGATIGKVGMLQTDISNVFINQRVCKFVPNEHICDKTYLYYLLSTQSFKNFIFNNIDSKLAQPNIGHPTIYKYSHLFPNCIKEQKLIASVLHNLDCKIALNHAINDNLEAMAKQLYDYWFVQFDFPNEEGKPYKSSGGAMVWNETLKREIPQGWSVLSVNDIATSVRGVSYAKEDMVDSNNGVLVLRGNNIQDNHLIYDSNVAYIPSSFVSEEQRIRPLDIIMTMSSGSKEHIGKSAMFQFASEDTFGAFLTKFTAKKHCAYLLFNLFNSQYFKAKIRSIACGTGINNLTNQTFDEIYIVMPKDKLLLEFDKRQSQIFAEIGLIEKSNVELTKQRDELLPLLMNGQASVNSD